jgi:hypothetical protein
MENGKVVEKMNELLVGFKGEFQAFDAVGKQDLGELTGVRTRGEKGGIIFFDFSSGKTVGLMVMLMIFSIVKEEVGDGFCGEEICKDFYLNGRDISEIFNSIFILFDKE